LRGWSLQIDGEVRRELKFSMSELKSCFKKVKKALLIECGGNGRAGYNPPAKGNQWTLGAVGCAEYEGVRLRDVLDAAGVKDSAVYIGYYGEDLHLSRDPDKEPISRGVPIAKALDEHTILAWQMNGEPLPAYHGFPLRLICPGWPASTGGKWLKRIWVRDQVHDGTKMTGTAYRVPRHPVAPGTVVPDEDMEIIHEMPVKSIITRPGTGITNPLAATLQLRGHAWSGWGEVKAMHVSIDFGATWISAELKAPRNAYAWQRWNAAVKFPKQGYYEVWARATDNRGQMQPMLVPGWNPKGYLNNAMQRIAVKVV
jgi:sulfite oxidase